MILLKKIVNRSMCIKDMKYGLKVAAEARALGDSNE